MNQGTANRANRSRATCIGCAMMLFVGGGAAVAEEPSPSLPKLSELWGESGEKYDPEGRLPDFSFAGYRQGERDIPEYPVAANVLDFGASPDDDTDDTEAFQAAIESVESGTIVVPNGRYIITDRLNITKSGVVLRGESMDGVVLEFPKGLEHIDPRRTTNTGGRELSAYSWSDGFLHIRGSISSGVVTTVTDTALRGSNVIEVADASSLEPGMRILLQVRDDEEKTLLDHLYGGDPGSVANINPASHTTQFVSYITEVDGNTVSMERRLRFDLRPEWSPQVRRFEPTVTDSGIENFTVVFPARTYGGHFTEDGYNAAAITNASDCWIRNLRVINSDSGLHLSGWFCTIDGLHLTTTEDAVPHRGEFGHHGVNIGRGDNLVTNFVVQQQFIHDLTISRNGGNVYSNGRGDNMAFDHHKRAPHANLFTNIDAGEGDRFFKSGGGQGLGRHSGAWETFWGIRTARPVTVPEGWGPDLMTFVAVETTGETIREDEGAWIEHGDMDRFEPMNLHEAQLARRLADRDR